MARPTTEAGQLVMEYLEKNPDVPSRTAAKYLFTQRPDLFISESSAGNRVRYYRGKAGKWNREKRIASKRRIYPHIPPGKKKASPTVRLRDKGLWAILGDLHIPYHSKPAVECAIEHSIKRGAKHLLLNGDIFDAYQVSHWVRDPKKRHIDHEIEVTKEFIHSVAPHFPGRKVYKIGNHEDRISAYLWLNAPQAPGMSTWTLESELRNRLELDDSWTVIGSKQLYTLGKLNGYHGHELPRGLTNPVSVGRGIWLRTADFGFAGHWHMTSGYTHTNGSKSQTWQCFSVGCLCDLQPDYGPVNRWNHGFCLVDISKGGEFNEENRRIHNGKLA